MTSFINNAKEFCVGFESVFPIGKITKFTVVKLFDFTCNHIAKELCPSKPDFGGYSASIDRAAYNAVMNRKDHFYN